MNEYERGYEASLRQVLEAINDAVDSGVRPEDMFVYVDTWVRGKIVNKYGGYRVPQHIRQELNAFVPWISPSVNMNQFIGKVSDVVLSNTPVEPYQVGTPNYCPATSDHKHEDTGGMFFFKCKHCNWSVDP